VTLEEFLVLEAVVKEWLGWCDQKITTNDYWFLERGII